MVLIAECHCIQVRVVLIAECHCIQARMVLIAEWCFRVYTRLEILMKDHLMLVLHQIMSALV